MLPGYTTTNCIASNLRIAQTKPQGLSCRTTRWINLFWLSQRTVDSFCWNHSFISDLGKSVNPSATSNHHSLDLRWPSMPTKYFPNQDHSAVSLGVLRLLLGHFQEGKPFRCNRYLLSSRWKSHGKYLIVWSIMKTLDDVREVMNTFWRARPLKLAS